MNEQEQQLISGLAERVRNAPVQQVDRDADDLIRRTIGARPDGLYILTQTVLLQEMALDHLKAQVAELQQQLAAQSAPARGSFLPATPPPSSSAPVTQTVHRRNIDGDEVPRDSRQG